MCTFSRYQCLFVHPGHFSVVPGPIVTFFSATKISKLGFMELFSWFVQNWLISNIN